MPNLGDEQTVTRDEYNDLKNEVEQLKSSGVFRGAVVSDDIDEHDSNLISSIIQDKMIDIMWNKIFYVSSFATASITTTASELLDANGRESDTTAGNRFKPDLNSRFKMEFYINSGLSKSIIYIGAPGITSLTSLAGASILDSTITFVGVKIDAGVVSAIYSHDGIQDTIPTGVTITDTTTHILEINYYITHTEIKFNGVIIADIDCKMMLFGDFETFFPYITSVGSIDGTSVNLTIESYEFLQERYN